MSLAYGEDINMPYSILKKRIKLLKSRGYRKSHGLAYVKVYRVNHHAMHQAISYFDLLYSHWELNEYLDYLYERNMKILFEKVLQDGIRSQE
jgi:hypothetical protein